MDRLSVTVLLLCSLGGADLQHKNSTVNVTSDVLVELQDLKTKLSLLQTNMEALYTLNQEQAAKLTKTETELQEQKVLNQGQAFDVTLLDSRMGQVESHVYNLNRDSRVGRVAFSASLLTSGYSFTGPLPVHSTLVFRNVISNVGNAYNANTGIFTAPVTGAYHFEFFIYGSESPGTAVWLVKNLQHVVMAQEEQSRGFHTAGNSVTLLLTSNDRVFLRLWQSYRIYDNQSRHCTFSGHLLFPM